MATISALDIKDAGSSYAIPNLGYDARQIDNTKPDRTRYAFDAYFAAGAVNEPHVQITNGQSTAYNSNTSYYTDNNSWIQNELRESAHNMPAQQDNEYNFGSPYRHLLPSVRIFNGGRVFINNKDRPIGGGASSTPSYTSPGNFDVYTSNCGTVVNVDDDGALHIGDEAYNARTGTLLMAANSLLDVRYNGACIVRPGSVLRIAAGGTLVVRSIGTLQIYGQVIVEAGAYLCVENPSRDVITMPGGSYTVSPGVIYGSNPALGLTGLACDQPPLQVSITSLDYTNNGSCYSPSGRNNYAQWTALATGGSGIYTYTWELDTDTGYGFQPVNDQGPVFGRCLNSYPGAGYIEARVTATSGSQQATATYYAFPQARPTMYPNPADEYVELANDDDTPSQLTSGKATTQSRAVAPKTASSTSVSGLVPMQVTVYNAQGRLVFTSPITTAPSIHLQTQAWPAGLYQVVTRRGDTTTRRQLSLQH